jgi:tetratricopeptide (TPR) repeat protein
VRRLEEALYYAENASALARQSGAPGVLAATLNHLGNALVAQLRYAEALKIYREGMALAERSSDPALAATLLTNAIHAHLANDTASDDLGSFPVTEGGKIHSKRYNSAQQLHVSTARLLLARKAASNAP